MDADVSSHANLVRFFLHFTVPLLGTELLGRFPARRVIFANLMNSVFLCARLHSRHHLILVAHCAAASFFVPANNWINPTVTPTTRIDDVPLLDAGFAGS